MVPKKEKYDPKKRRSMIPNSSLRKIDSGDLPAGIVTDFSTLAIQLVAAAHLTTHSEQSCFLSIFIHLVTVLSQVPGSGGYRKRRGGSSITFL